MNELSIRQKLKDNYQHYAKKNLKILDKATGHSVPFEFNEAQIYADQIAQKQLKETGRVRLNVLKGRQQGISTYVQGRAYWRTSHNIGYNAFIMTHLASATSNLFAMTRRYHDNCKPILKPSTSGDSKKELIFDKLDSKYSVGTAGNKNTGVSTTNRFLHASEVALWENSGAIAVGLLQTVPDADDTEVWRESTARGMGNYFHTQWKLSEAGDSDYWNVFIPWYWSSEYSKEAPDDFDPTEEELEVLDQFRPFTDIHGKEHKVMTNDQLYWRRMKISDMDVDGTDAESLFKQEYPMNAAEAFAATSSGGLILPKWVTKARASKLKGYGPVIMGVDPSFGGDRFSIAVRRGREVLEVVSFSGNQIETVGMRKSKVTTMIDKYKPDMTFIDSGGGADLVDLLHESGHHKVLAVPFGGSADNEDRFNNKRSEMWGLMGNWFNDDAYEVNIPDSDSLQADLCAGLYQRDTNNRLTMVKKDIIKKKLGFSPDEGDALALTFAQPVMITDNYDIQVSSGV